MADDQEPAAGAADSFRNLDRAAAAAGRTVAAVLAEGEASGRRFESALKAAGEQLARIGLQAGTRALAGSLAGTLAPALGGLAQGIVSAAGLAAPPALSVLEGSIAPEAAATAGRDSAVVGQQAISVVMNVSTPDAESFRRSEGQIGAALSRLVARGQRLL
jgi:hypothetical protein